MSSFRLTLLEIWGNECSACGSSENLEIHHIDRNRKNNVIENLQLFCRDCHREAHSRAWGVKVGMNVGSLTMTIPKYIVKKMNLVKGDEVLVSMINENMIVRKQD